MFSAFFAAVLVLAPKEASPPPFVEIAADNVEAQIMPGERAALLLVRGANAKEVERLVASTIPGVTAIETLALPKGRYQLTVLSDSYFDSVSADRRGRRWQVNAKLTAVDARVGEYLRGAFPRTVPSDYQSPPLREAENKFRAGDWKAARLAFEKLKEDYALGSWASIRLGDVAWLSDDIKVACESYLPVAQAQQQRTVGLLARIRSTLVGCEALDLDGWLDLTARVVPVDGEIGVYLRQELVRALRVHERRADVIGSAVPLLRPVREPALQRQVDGWLAEPFFARQPLVVANAYQFLKLPVTDHASARILLQRSAQAHATLMLPTEALAIATTLNKLKKKYTDKLAVERMATAQEIQLRATLLQATGQVDEAKELFASVEKMAGPWPKNPGDEASPAKSPAVTERYKNLQSRFEAAVKHVDQMTQRENAHDTAEAQRAN